MTKERFELYCALQNELETAANELLSRHNALIKECGLGSEASSACFPEFGSKNAANFHTEFCFTRYDEDDQVLKYWNRETWSFGGEEEYFFELPVSYLFSNEWEALIRAKCQDVIDAKNAGKKKKADDTERRERKLLDELKAKYKNV